MGEPAIVSMRDVDVLALVHEADVEARIQVGQLSKASPDAAGHPARILAEDGGVWKEGDAGARSLGRRHHLHGARRRTDLVALAVVLAASPDVDLKPGRERIHARESHAVESPRDLIRAASELPAGMQGGHHHLQCRATGVAEKIGGDTASVVLDGAAAVRVHGHGEPVRCAGQDLVDGIVDKLGQAVMQPIGTCRANEHGRPHSDGLKPGQDLDGLGAVVGGRRHDLSSRPNRFRWAWAGRGYFAAGFPMR